MTHEEIEAQVAEIAARDVGQWCAVCGARYVGEPEKFEADPDVRFEDTHDFSAEECDERLVGRVEPDPASEAGHLCADRGAHHPFVEGDPPDDADFDGAIRDRRVLLRIVRGLLDGSWA